MQKSNPKVQIIFQRERHVQSCEFSNLLEAFNPEGMTKSGLKTYCNSVQILFQGFDGDERPPFLIPEIRSFVRSLRRSWFHAPYFCDLDHSFLALDAYAALENFTVMERAGSEVYCVTHVNDELRQYVREAHQIIENLGTRAQMVRAQIESRKIQFDFKIEELFGPFFKA